MYTRVCVCNDVMPGVYTCISAPGLKDLEESATICTKRQKPLGAAAIWKGGCVVSNRVASKGDSNNQLFT